MGDHGGGRGGLDSDEMGVEGGEGLGEGVNIVTEENGGVAGRVSDSVEAVDQQGGQSIEGGSRDEVPAALLEEAHDNVKEVESEDGKDGGSQDPVVPGGVG